MIHIITLVCFMQLNQELAVNRESGKKHQESANEKLVRKFKENPLIPIGNINNMFIVARSLQRLSPHNWVSREWAVQVW